MEFQVLGPFEVRREGGPVPLGPAKQRTLLAILLVRANEIVSSDRLIEELWPEPPDTAGNALQVYVHKLRKALEPERRRGESGELLITRAPGYMLRVEPFREIGEGWFLSTVAVDLPRAVYEQGRYDDAFALLGAIDENPAPTDSEWLIKRTGVPARLLARRRRFEEAERLAREGVAVAANCEFVVLHADVLLDLAEVLRLAGRPDEAEAATAEAVNIYERKGNVAAAERARALAETG
jgi:DNA-binding SARP family transcriptional activator